MVFCFFFYWYFLFERRKNKGFHWSQSYPVCHRKQIGTLCLQPMTLACSCNPSPLAIYYITPKSRGDQRTQQKDGAPHPNMHMHTPLHLFLPHSPHLVLGGKVLCVWGQGDDHTQHSTHLGVGRTAHTLWELSEVNANHFWSLPKLERTFFPPPAGSLFRILYNPTLSSLSHTDTHSQREKLIPEYWVINYTRSISLENTFL